MDRLRARREFNNDNIVRWWNTTIAVGVVRIAWSERTREREKRKSFIEKTGGEEGEGGRYGIIRKPGTAISFILPSPPWPLTFFFSLSLFTPTLARKESSLREESVERKV